MCRGDPRYITPKPKKRCENKDWIYAKKHKNNLKNRLKWKNTKSKKQVEIIKQII